MLRPIDSQLQKFDQTIFKA